MTIIKRIAAPKWWPIEKKTKKFVIVPRGPYLKNLSLPLLVLIRDVLKLADNEKEASKIIKKGEILIDGRKRKDPKFGIGLFNIIEIPLMKKAYRAVPKNGLSFIEIPEKEAKLKICKIVNKKSLKGNKNQINLNDGRNILTNENYSTYDSLLIEVPEQKIIDHIKFAENSTCMIFKGKNAGKIGKIKTIKKDRVLIGDEKTIEVPKDFVIVVGREQPLVKLE
jgi:small subunit ribosomal protein S4e